MRTLPTTRQELAQFARNDERLQQLVEPISASHPLVGWAKELVVLGHHPEYYEPEFLTELRNEETRQRVRAQHLADAQMVAELDEEECLTAPVDVDYLRVAAEYARQSMRWRSRQLRAARRNVPAYASATRRT